MAYSDSDPYEVDVIIISQGPDFIRMKADEMSKPVKVPKSQVRILTNVNNYAKISLREDHAIAYGFA